MELTNNDLVLSVDEIVKITHRKRPVEQLRDLIALGIPAVRRHDNTICVLRADVTTRRQSVDNVPEPRPQRKSVKQ
jgi:hypothetical protein